MALFADVIRSCGHCSASVWHSNQHKTHQKQIKTQHSKFNQKVQAKYQPGGRAYAKQAPRGYQLTRGVRVGLAVLLGIHAVILNVSVANAQYNVGVLAKLSCDGDIGGGQVTTADVQSAFTDAVRMFPGTNNVQLYNNSVTDTCSEDTALNNILTWTSKTGSPVSAIIGPGLSSFCDTTATLSVRANKPLVSYSCMDDRFRHRQLFPTFRHSIPDTRSTARALAEVVRHFRWKRVAVFWSGWQPWLDMANDVQRVLTTEDFDVRALVSLPTNFTQEQARDTLSANVDTTIKAVVACMTTSNMASFLLGARLAGLTSGTHALFVMDVYGTFNLASLDTSQPEEVNITVDDELSTLEEATRALFVLRSAPSTSLHLTFNTSQSSQTKRDLRNAVLLLVAGLREAETQGGDVTSGLVVTSAMSNLTFNSSSGDVILDGSGIMNAYFTIYDYKADSGNFQAVLEVASSNWALTLSGTAISWPNGAPPEPDTCDFIDCSPAEIPGGAIAAIVVVGVLLLTVASVGGYLIRRRMLLKEMEKGPNKILLTIDDLTFVSPKSVNKNSRSFKSQSIFDKPDLLKASEPSLSLHSFNNEFGEYTDVARYNGDMVYVKELKIKNFEIKGKVRNFIRALRDLRHENINPFIGCFIDPLRPSLVAEWCQRRSLEDVLSNETIKLDWDFKLSLITDLVRGMRYLHASPIKVHGNLKSGNCVIDSRWVLKITEYGLAGMYERYETSREQKSKDLLWTAPEVLRDPLLLGKGTQKGDVYSFSIILQEIIVRGHPFCMLELDADEIIKKIKKPPPLCRPSVSQQMAPPSYIQIMKQCWSEMPDMRPDFDQINQQFKDLNKGKKVNVVDTMFKMLEKYSNDLEDIVRVRTNELEEEKKKTENLLAQMLPASVAASLMTGKPVEAESFQEVTIYFSDIVGFTTISAMSTPMQVVALLNDLYTMFDSTIDNHDVYKVETIGDAYMVVSGLPERNGRRHAGEVAAMALNLTVQCGSFRIRHMPDIPMMLRSGLHTGPCVAGVVGLRMPRYCLFGDTVNTASRMESTGLAYRIHVSGETKEILDELGGYKLDCRGEVELKGKGFTKTYWLVGMDGFNQQLPEPPEANGPDNHGLMAYIAKDKLEAAVEAKKQAEKEDYAKAAGETTSHEPAKEQAKTTETAKVTQPAETTEKPAETTEQSDASEAPAQSDTDKNSEALIPETKKLENGGQTIVAEINHVNETVDDAESTRKTSVLKQEDIKISAKQADNITPVESVK